MRYLAILLLAPWLLILCGTYAAYPKSLPKTRGRRIFDVVVVLLAAVASVEGALLGFDAVSLPALGEFGKVSGGIWQQVLPALYGYGACLVVLVLGLAFRWLIWTRRG
jgi:hypothetical protein